jgi:hypothetical protein
MREAKTAATQDDRKRIAKCEIASANDDDFDIERKMANGWYQTDLWSGRNWWTRSLPISGRFAARQYR